MGNIGLNRTKVVPPSSSLTSPITPSSPVQHIGSNSSSDPNKHVPRSLPGNLPWNLHASVADWDMNSNADGTESDQEVTFHPSTIPMANTKPDSREEWSWMSDDSDSGEQEKEFSTPEKRIFDTATGVDRRQRYTNRYGHQRCLTPEGLRSSRPVAEVDLVPEGQISPVKL